MISTGTRYRSEITYVDLVASSLLRLLLGRSNLADLLLAELFKEVATSFELLDGFWG